MATTNSIYRRLHGLLLEPRGPVFVVTIGNDRWISDRYVLIHAGNAGVEAAIGNLPDGAYKVLASREPIPHTSVYGDIAAYADVISKKLDAFENDEYYPVESTPWLLAGNDGVSFRMMVRHSPDQNRITFANADLIYEWESTFTPGGKTQRALFEQAGHLKPIRVRQLRTFASLDPKLGRTVEYRVLIGYIVPARVYEVPPFPIEAPPTVSMR